MLKDNYNDNMSDNINIKNDIQRSLGRIEGKLQEGFVNINKRLDVVNGSLKIHDIKINDLETFRDYIKGREQETIRISGIGGAIVGGFITAVVWILTKIFK